jgi:hypothetical protein
MSDIHDLSAYPSQEPWVPPQAPEPPSDIPSYFSPILSARVDELQKKISRSEAYLQQWETAIQLASSPKVIKERMETYKKEPSHIIPESIVKEIDELPRQDPTKDSQSTWRKTTRSR